jgi:DNA-binding Xre family transcriptional regulator
MTIRRVSQQAQRTPEETARLRADRARYQRDKPTVEQLLAEGGHSDTVPLGEFLALREIMFGLKRERERQGLTLAQLEERTGIDQAALSRLETGKQTNPTLDTVMRIAFALGKVVFCELRDLPAAGTMPVGNP